MLFILSEEIVWICDIITVQSNGIGPLHNTMGVTSYWEVLAVIILLYYLTKLFVWYSNVFDTEFEPFFGTFSFATRDRTVFFSKCWLSDGSLIGLYFPVHTRYGVIKYIIPLE